MQHTGLLGCTFDSNTAEVNGGAVHVTNLTSRTTVLEYAGCIFDTNTAENSGGAVYEGDPRLDITYVNSLFVANEAEGDGTDEGGGAIFNGGSTSVSYVNGTFVDNMAKGGGDGIGCTKAGKGVKIMVLVDARGLPVAVDTASASPHECNLVQRLFDFMLTEENRVIGDKAYDSDKLAEELAEQDIELIAPHRKSRRPENVTQDGRPLRRYKRRWTVERTIAWMQHYRRLCIRREKSTTLFQGFLHFGCTMLLLKEVLE